MAVNIAIVTTATTGASVAIDRVGSTDYQYMKVVDGTPGETTPIAATTGIPAAASTGLIVAVKPGVSVSAQVSGSVTLLGTALASIVPGVSVTIIGQAVAVSGVIPVTTAASVSVTGLPVWLNPTQAVVVNTLAAGFSVNALVTGPVSISAGVIQSITVMSTLVTLLGTVAVNVVAGAAGGGSVTTTAPGITASGQVMWIVGGQSTTVSPVFVSIIQTSVSVAALPTVNTVVTVLGAVLVSVSGIVAVTTQASVSVSGLPVWFQNGATVALVPGVSITWAAGATVAIVPGVSITWAAGNTVAIVPGVSVLAQISAIVPVTTAVSVSVSGLPIWINPTAAVGTIVTILGTQLVSNVGTVRSTVGTVLAVSGITAVSVVSSIVTILGTQIVTVAGMLFTTASPAQSSTGQIVAYKGNVNIPVVIQISSTIVGSSTTMLMTVYTGATFGTTGASFWVVPAGRTFRIMGMQIIAVSSAVLSAAQFVVIVGTAAASISVVASVGIPACLCYAIQASTTPFAMGGLVADVSAGTTVGVGVKGGTSHSILQAAINGYLF